LQENKPGIKYEKQAIRNVRRSKYFLFNINLFRDFIVSTEIISQPVIESQDILTATRHFMKLV